MNISCKQYQMVQSRIQDIKQSNPKSIVKPEASYNPTQSTKGLGCAIPEYMIFVHRYRKGIPLSRTVQD